MTLIFWIAAGIIIGLLAVQAILFKLNEKEIRNNVDMSFSLYEMQEKYGIYKKRYFNLKSALLRYYNDKKKLPHYISDMNCDVREVGVPVGPCADVQKDGRFYVSYQNLWAETRPYVEEGILKFDCKMDRGYAQYDTDLLLCDDIAGVVIPERKSPSFDCAKAATKVERIICQSDRLVDVDLELDKAYQLAAKAHSSSQLRRLKHEQLDFIHRREAECTSDKCVDMMTRERIAELRAMQAG